MRLTLVALIAVLCLAYAYAMPADDAQPDNEQVGQIGLLDVADQGANHANDGAREARQWGGGGWGSNGWGGRHGGWSGGCGRGGCGGGWGGGGWGGGGWGGGGRGGGGKGWGGHGGWGR